MASGQGALPPVDDGVPMETAQSRQQAEKEQLKKTLARLQFAEVAGPKDRESLVSTSKADISAVKVLGEGAFGLVDLVLVDRGANLAPLLCVRKKLLKQTDNNNNDPTLEVDFLDACSGCEFVVQMWSHVVGLYDYTLLLEYCPYSSLDKLLSIVSEHRSRSGNACMDWLTDKVLKSDRHAGFTEDEARFFIGCCVLGLKFMHGRGILHRDLKPSNLLVADNRYVKLGDLGLCKVLGEDGRAYTHVGTPGYMAPEVVHGASQGQKNQGYSYPADIWSLGIMLWELVDGRWPKWAPLSWYWTSTLHFPQHFSPALRSLLAGMLNKDQRERIKLPDIIKHPWFEGFDWKACSNMTLKPPDMPEFRECHIHTKLIPPGMSFTNGHNTNSVSSV